MSFCTFCSRITVFVMNLAMLLVALTVIGLSLWIWFDKDFESEIRANIKVETDPEPLSHTKSDIRTGIIVSFWVIIGFSIANTLIGLAGSLGAVANSRSLIAVYFVCMVLIILLEIAVGIVVLVKRGDVRSTVKEYVFYAYSMNAYPDVQAFQFRYNCCGVERQPNTQCMAGQPTCSSAVWDRLDFTMMIFGISMLVVVVLQIIVTVFSIFIFIRPPSRHVTYMREPLASPVHHREAS